MTRTAHDEVEAILAAARAGGASRRSSPPLQRRSYYQRARRRRGWVMSLNLTPMIDTVFNLLFFFMIVSRFGAIEGLLPASLPVQAAAAAPAPAAGNVPRMPLRIQLEADAAHPDRCQYRIDRLVERPAPIRELPARLARIRESEPGFGGDTAVYLVAGDSVAWDHVVNAYNAALSARYEKIYFAGAK
jgi:biopolymer transport protein ExbD